MATLSEWLCSDVHKEFLNLKKKVEIGAISQQEMIEYNALIVNYDKKLYVYLMQRYIKLSEIKNVVECDNCGKSLVFGSLQSLRLNSDLIHLFERHFKFKRSTKALYPYQTEIFFFDAWMDPDYLSREEQDNVNEFLFENSKQQEMDTISRLHLNTHCQCVDHELIYETAWKKYGEF